MSETVEERLIARLGELDERYESLNRQLAEPEVATNPARSVAIAKELGKLRRLVEPFRDLCKTRSELQEAHEISADPSQDGEMRELAEQEISELKKEYAVRLERLKESVVTSEASQISSVILEIRAGTGGAEAALFARDLYEMYLRYCDRHRFRVEVINQSGSDMGGFKEIILNIKGKGVYSHLGYEGGGHRVQRVPQTESQGRVHTSAVTVAVLPEPEEIDLDINWDKDVDEFISRAGGPGGQNVNKVSSAIRLIHHDTGITVSMRDEKSQHKNRAKARRIMTARLYDHFEQQAKSERSAVRRSMVGSGDRSQRVRTYNFPQNRCTDHRINLDLYSLDKIMQGEMEPLVEALGTFDKEQQLKNL
ncbi:MAG: peptide chain release factor 1 [Phycisphaerae bacterium]